MAYARNRDATYTSVETGMLEWINHMLRQGCHFSLFCCSQNAS
jgi:hypothetical protein